MSHAVVHSLWSDQLTIVLEMLANNFNHQCSLSPWRTQMPLNLYPTPWYWHILVSFHEVCCMITCWNNSHGVTFLRNPISATLNIACHYLTATLKATYDTTPDITTRHSIWHTAMRRNTRQLNTRVVALLFVASIPRNVAVNIEGYVAISCVMSHCRVECRVEGYTSRYKNDARHKGTLETLHDSATPLGISRKCRGIVRCRVRFFAHINHDTRREKRRTTMHECNHRCSDRTRCLTISQWLWLVSQSWCGKLNNEKPRHFGP